MALNWLCFPFLFGAKSLISGRMMALFARIRSTVYRLLGDGYEVAQECMLLIPRQIPALVAHFCVSRRHPRYHTKRPQVSSCKGPGNSPGLHIGASASFDQ